MFCFFFVVAGSLIKSQFPVFTIYAQKSCLKMRPCERAWCIDRVQGYALKDHIKRSATAMSRQDCYEMCFGETDFLCRWVISTRCVYVDALLLTWSRTGFSIRFHNDDKRFICSGRECCVNDVTKGFKVYTMTFSTSSTKANELSKWLISRTIPRQYFIKKRDSHNQIYVFCCLFVLSSTRIDHYSKIC